MITFELDSDYIELCQLLKLMGPFTSGGEAKVAISQGAVTVDGHVETRKKCKIRVGSVVTYQQLTIKVIEPSHG